MKQMKLKTIPVGRPIANTQIYIFDQRRNPVPIGIPGELYVGGTSVGRGYLNRPELTQAKFIPHPFSSHAGDRLYRTGDLARYLPDGNIEFLGRIDTQVKIRGIRIELGEVEATLNTHPQIQQAIVLVREDPFGDKCLVAYIVGEVRSADQLQEFLRQMLPAYMLPSAFIGIDSIPLTPNGKIDHKALNALKGSEILPSLEYVAPQTSTQEKLVQIWSELLGKEQVGIYNNFFELGGHSLLATQSISRIQLAEFIEAKQSLFQQNSSINATLLEDREEGTI
jgi:acyl-coenzyme A synthetase/AMP-(fatty) acid ligase